jgi:hypothetical protein
LPSYLGDVKKVAKVLLEKDVLTQKTKRELKCKTLCHDRNPYENTVSGLEYIITYYFLLSLGKLAQKI